MQATDPRRKMLDLSWPHDDIVRATELGSAALSLLKLIWRPASARHCTERRGKRQNQRNATARDRNGQVKDEGEEHVRFVGRVQTEGNWDLIGLGNGKGVSSKMPVTERTLRLRARRNQAPTEILGKVTSRA